MRCKKRIPTDSIIGGNLRTIRKSRQISAQELGYLIGYRECTITAFERGERSISGSSLAKLCIILECSADDIIFNNKKELYCFPQEKSS